MSLDLFRPDSLLDLNDVVNAPSAYQQFTPQDVRDAFARYYKPESRFRFVITPDDASGGKADAEGTKG